VSLETAPAAAPEAAREAAPEADPIARAAIRSHAAGSQARPASLRSWRRWAPWAALGVAAAAVHLVLVWLTVTRQLDPFFNDARHRLGPGTDLAAYVDAGRAWLDGGGVFGGGPAFGYRYHPFLAMTAGASFARMPFGMAFLLWTLVIEALWVANLIVLRKMIASTRRWLALAAILLVFTPAYLDLYMGNASFVAGSLMLIAWWCDRTGRRALFRTLFVVSLLVKPIGLVLVPWLLLRRRFADLAVVLGAIVLLAVPYFAYRPQDMMGLLTSNLRATPGWTVHAGNQGLHGLLATLFTRLEGIRTWDLATFDQLGPASRLALLVLPLAVMTLALRGAWVARDRPEVGAFLWWCVYPLAFHDVWEHSYAAMVFGLGLLWSVDAVPRRWLAVASAGIALPTLFVVYDLPLPAGPYDPEHGWGMGVSLLHHATKPLWLALLFGMCLLQAEAARRRAAAKPAEPLEMAA
jgi:hypothetical protein